MHGQPLLSGYIKKAMSRPLLAQRCSPRSVRCDSPTGNRLIKKAAAAGVQTFPAGGESVYFNCGGDGIENNWVPKVNPKISRSERPVISHIFMFSVVFLGIPSGLKTGPGCWSVILLCCTDRNSAGTQRTKTKRLQTGRAGTGAGGGGWGGVGLIWPVSRRHHRSG